MEKDEEKEQQKKFNHKKCQQQKRDAKKKKYNEQVNDEGNVIKVVNCCQNIVCYNCELGYNPLSNNEVMKEKDGRLVWKSRRRSRRKNNFLLISLFVPLLIHYFIFCLFGVHHYHLASKSWFIFPSASALGSNCKCIEYDDSYRLSAKDYGTFTSPNYPLNYDSGIDCLLYTFRGPSNHIVQLTFNSFNLQRVAVKNGLINDCSSGDYIKMYLNLNKEEADDDDNRFISSSFGRQNSLLKRDNLIANDPSSNLTQDGSGRREEEEIKMFKTKRRKKRQASEFRKIFSRRSINRVKGSINELIITKEDKIICGGSLPQSQLVHYSRENILILEFHSMDFYEYLNLIHKADAQKYKNESSFAADDVKNLENSRSNISENNSSDNRLSEYLNNKFGFSGSYKFLSKNLFKSDGDPLSGTICDYEFLSILTSNAEDDEEDEISFGDRKYLKKPRMEGKFFSPNYPSSFDPNLKCAYHFMGKFNEKISITFDKVNLNNDYDTSCLDSANSLTIYDGRNDQAPIIGRLCSNKRSVQLISSSSDLYIEFVSSAGNADPSFGTSSSSSGTSRGAAGSGGNQGFRAYYKFIPDPISRRGNNHYNPSSSFGKSPSPKSSGKFGDNPSINTWNQIPSTEPDPNQVNEGGAKSSASLTDNSSPCVYNYSSDSKKSGTIHSPNYPLPYNIGSSCTYHFSGFGRERIQISFTDFDLFVHPHDSSISRDCEDSDSIMILVNINGNRERIDNFCGNNHLPAQVMSNGPTLTIEFVSISRTNNDRFNNLGHTPYGGQGASNGINSLISNHLVNHNFRGFRATYKFLTDFGIIGSGGSQDIKRGVCAFVYKSDENKNGSLSSPNYPGLYPRETECHYFFHGNPNERVHIHFNHFDVEGVPPCTHESASDYVEFSNYPTVDRKLSRMCGIKKPTKVTSDGEYYRITFKSNDKFDGTGFNAFYSFENVTIDEKSIASRMPKDVASSCISLSSNYLTYFIVTLLISISTSLITLISYVIR